MAWKNLLILSIPSHIYSSKTVKRSCVYARFHMNNGISLLYLLSILT